MTRPFVHRIQVRRRRSFTMRLRGKRAVVTGASRGIGAAIATRLAGEGAHVAVNYASSPEAAEKVVDAIRSNGGEATAMRADVASRPGITELFRQVDELFGGPLDILVNNAGFFPLGSLEESTEADFEKVV